MWRKKKVNTSRGADSRGDTAHLSMDSFTALRLRCTLVMRRVKLSNASLAKLNSYLNNTVVSVQSGCAWLLDFPCYCFAVAWNKFLKVSFHPEAKSKNETLHFTSIFMSDFFIFSLASNVTISLPCFVFFIWKQSLMKVCLIVTWLRKCLRLGIILSFLCRIENTFTSVTSFKVIGVSVDNKWHMTHVWWTDKSHAGHQNTAH